MKQTRIKTVNGAAVQLQSYTESGSDFELALRVEMPSNARGGVSLIHDDDEERYLRAVERVRGWFADGGRFQSGGGYFISYAVNGCTGAWCNGNGRVTQKKIDAAVKRLAKIVGKMRLTF